MFLSGEIQTWFAVDLVDFCGARKLQISKVYLVSFLRKIFLSALLSDFSTAVWKITPIMISP